MTRYCWVDLVDCCKRLGVIEADLTPGKPICSMQDYRAKIRSQRPTLVRTNRVAYGIPQGSPISALLSNISMLPFDEAISRICYARKWSYLRYSDDILVIGESGDGGEINAVVSAELSKLGSSLSINAAKTEILDFFVQSGVQMVKPQNGGVSFKPLQYLGFAFDGRKITIKSATLSRYWRKLIKSTRAAKIRAKKRKSKGHNGVLLKHRVYEQVTHLGKNNFHSYVRRARKKLSDESIRRQLARHFDRVELELK